MIKSKYVGRTFDEGWTVVTAQIAGRYGLRKKAKGNSYRYILMRTTSDGKCDKSLIISRPTMAKIARGITTVERVEANKTGHVSKEALKNASYYRFKRD